MVFWANVINERTHNNRQRNYFSKKIIQKSHKWILKSNTHNTDWLVDPFMQVKSTWQTSTQISNWRAQADLKMYISYKDIYKCINFFFKNVIFLSIEYKINLKILQKLCLVCNLVAFQNRLITGLWRKHRIPPLSTNKKLSINSFKLSLPSVSFHGIFLTYKCETLVLKTTTWDVSITFVSPLRIFV